VEFTLKKEMRAYGKFKKIGNFFWSSCKIIERYFRFRRQIDLVFTSGSGWLPSLIAWLAWLDRKPLVKEIVLMGSDDPLTVVQKIFFLRWIFTLPFFFADRIVVLSPVLKEACIQFGIPEKKIWFRLNPVILPSKLKEQPPVSPDSLPIIFWVGVLSPRKNVEFLLEAARHLSFPAHLCFAGPASDEAHMEKLAALARKLPPFLKVSFLGRIDDQNRLYALYRQAKLFWFSSLKEGSPNVVAESLLCGTPVVSLPIMGAVPFLVENGQDGEVADTDSLSPKEFARIADRWLTKDVSRESIAFRAQQRFDHRPVDAKYVEHFQEIIDRKRAAQPFAVFSFLKETDLS
jgi:glycosyltransferase involved in cell wall biosynthesis